MPIEGRSSPNVVKNAGKFVKNWPYCERNGHFIFCGSSFTNISPTMSSASTHVCILLRLQLQLVYTTNNFT